MTLPILAAFHDRTLAQRPPLSDALACTISAMIARYIAAEHICALPRSGYGYAPISSSPAPHCPDTLFACPECSQVWRRQ